MQLMTITQAAEAAGVTPKMARHYEALGLISPTHRSEAGYRLYGADDVRMLRIVGRARDLGFGLSSIARLLAAARAGSTEEFASEMEARVAELERQQRQLARMLDVLRALQPAEAVLLHPFDRSQCPALLEEGEVQAPRRLRGRHQAARTEVPPAPARNLLFSAWGSPLAQAA